MGEIVIEKYSDSSQNVLNYEVYKIQISYAEFSLVLGAR